jgi:hypothetical protein
VLIKHVVGRIIKRTERGGRRLEQLLHYLKGNKTNWNLKGKHQTAFSGNSLWKKLWTSLMADHVYTPWMCGISVSTAIILFYHFPADFHYTHSEELFLQHLL